MNKEIKIHGKQHLRALAAMEKNMLVFGKVCLPNMFSSPSPEFHKELIKLFHDPNEKRLNIIAPRGHAKSSLAGCVWVLHHLFFQPGPKFIVLVSKTEGHTIRLLQTIKNALDYSPHILKYMGYWGEHAAKSWKNNEVILKDGTMILCRGTGQMIVGLKHGDQRPTLVILDDPEDMNNTKTAEAMEFNLRWLLQALMPTLDPMTGRIAIIGTPQHQRCMVEMLSNAKGWNTRRYKSIQDDNSVLWPERMPYAKLMEEKEIYASMGRVSSFYREYQCQIIGDEDQIFRMEDFRYFDGYLVNRAGKQYLHITHLNHAKLEGEEAVAINVFMGIDPASSTSEIADFSTVVVVAVDEKGRRFVLDYYRQRVTPMTLAQEIMKMFDQYKPAKTRIESTGYQEMLRDYLRSQKYIPGLEIKEMPRHKKSKRLEGMQPLFAQHLMHMRDTQTALIDELLMYPRGKHDDLLDGLYYASKNNYMPFHRYEDPAKDMKHHLEFTEDPKVDWVTL